MIISVGCALPSRTPWLTVLQPPRHLYFFLISNKTCHSGSKAKLVRKITPKAAMGPFWWLYLFISRQWPWQPWKKRWRRRKHRKKPAALSNPVDTVASLNQLKWLWFFELTSTNLGKRTLFSMICLDPQWNRGWTWLLWFDWITYVPSMEGN